MTNTDIAAHNELQTSTENSNRTASAEAPDGDPGKSDATNENRPCTIADIFGEEVATDW